MITDKKKRKILIIATLPPPVHGSNVMNQYVVDSTRVREAYTVRVFPLRYAKTLGDIGSFRLDKFRALFCYLTRLSVVLLQFQPDLVYFVPAVTGPSFYRDCLYMALCKLLHRQVIVHLHGKGIREASKHSINRRLYRWFFQNTHIILLSPLLFEDIATVAHRTQVHFLPNGIRASYHGKPEKIAEESIPTFLYLSNLVVSKGPLIFLEACRNLMEQGYQFRADFVGAETPELTAERFQELLCEYRLENHVTYHGPQYGKAKEVLLARSHVLVFPTYFPTECFPLVILEAMEYGLPVISTYEGAIPEMVRHGETGLLVAQQDVQSLAEAMKTCIVQRERCTEMGLIAQKRFREFYTLDTFEENLHMIFDQTLIN